MATPGQRRTRIFPLSKTGWIGICEPSVSLTGGAAFVPDSMSRLSPIAAQPALGSAGHGNAPTRRRGVAVPAWFRGGLTCLRLLGAPSVRPRTLALFGPDHLQGRRFYRLSGGRHE
jgi:hypothetical protein